MRYEVIGRDRHGERVITTTRRENGAANERDIAADASYRNYAKRTDAIGGRVVRGADAKDPNAVVVIYDDADGRLHVETFTYRPVGGWPTPNPDLTDVLLASIVAVTGGSK